MVRFAKIVVALLCILCVLALCIAPFVDIPVTVLKSLHVILLMILSLAGTVLLLASLFQSVFIRQSAEPTNRKEYSRWLPIPVETNCVQRI
jgi:ABC-type protease/lipase transport system fused ATPase/permease subunit